jgi:prepilin-type N-terminal cleavage/methylation domain-containing protein/prepilin-type processing-associated H-X9-DG protein
MIMPSPKRHSAFTLIELLVVIAIIAILAAILFPVFAQVREKARQTTCVSNEKQMGLAMLQYVQDNDETFPMSQYFGLDGTPHDWASVVYPYVKNGQATNVTSTGETVNNGQGGIWNCPSFPTNQVDNYGIHLFIAPQGAPNYPNPVTTSLAKIDAPASKILILEKGQGAQGGYPIFDAYEYDWVNWEGGDPPTNPTPTQKDLQWDFDQAISATTPNGFPGPACMPRYRHQAHCNCLFVDGHVKSIVKGRLDWYTYIYIPGVSDGIY